MSAHLGTCAQATRVLLILLNILFLLLGIGIIAGGSVLVATGHTLQVFSGPLSPVGVSALIIVAGIFTFIIAGLAILGAIFKSRILLGIYLVVVVIIILLEVAAAIVGIVKRRDVAPTLDNFVEGLIEEYGQNETDATNAINAFQELFRCCGWVNYTDFTNPGYPIPDSCQCTQSTPPDECTEVDNESIWKTGCRQGVTHAFNIYLGVVIAVAILIALIELVAVLCACGLCCCIHRGIDENNYTKV